MTVAVAVVLPDVPVMVIVRVPVWVFGPIFTRIAAVPEPFLTVAGANCTITPLPCPEADKATVPVKPPEGVTVILDSAWPFGAAAIDFGAAVIVKLPPPPPVTVRLTVVVSVVLPDVPVTVIV